MCGVLGFVEELWDGEVVDGGRECGIREEGWDRVGGTAVHGYPESVVAAM